MGIIIPTMIAARLSWRDWSNEVRRFLRGEPIVNTPAEAFNTFMASGMDTLVLGDHVVDKRAVTGGKDTA